MAQDPDSWIHNPAFQWTPETPLRLEPQITGTLPAEDEIAEPRIENPALREPVAKPAPQAKAPSQAKAPVGEKSRGASLFLPRMVVGFAQGVFLSALLAARDAIDPTIFSAALMVLLFAPLVLLAGLGRMRDAPLLLWTGCSAALLAALGAYHHWRTLSSDGGHPGLVLLALAGLFFFIAHAIAQAWASDYTAHYRSAWRLAIRIAFCALFAALAWATLGAATGYVREHYAQLQFAPLMLPLLTLSIALAAQLTGEKFLGALQEGALFVFTLALPFLLVLALAICGLGALGRWQPSLLVSLLVAGLMIVTINASYRDGTSWRPYWRRRAEFAASLLLTPLALLAAFALAQRVQQYGWTDNRIFLVAAILLLGGYALCYAGSALISLGGGGWMQRIEGSNLALAFAALALIAALASPIADPARLAVASQTFRLEQNKVRADMFDFLWLRDGGLRFGHDALEKMAADKTAPAMARGAFVALAAPPEAGRPTPTEIGANIHVHSPVGLPTGLLARDWSHVADAPPCLTSAAIACDAFFADLDGDGRSEVLLAYGNDQRWWAGLMKQGAGGGWYVAGTLAAPACPGSLEALRAGHFTAVRPSGAWRDLVVNGVRLSVDRPVLPMACPD